VAELNSEFDLKGNGNIVISGKWGMPGKNPIIAIYWKQKSEALKKQIEKKANEKIAPKEEAKKPKGHMKA
jgi:hypothetical protein